MNVVTVAKQLDNFIEKKETSFSNTNWHSSSAHLRYMCRMIIERKVENSQAHRWIGYIQGCLVTLNLTTVNEMKRLNKDA